jgi:peptide chain release factor 3
MHANSSPIDPAVSREASRRRTFAIISHPDAGKTTLTEKLLLYGGCVDVAGAVRGRKTQRAATSDWMELERQRGISVSSTALSFDFEGFRVNLLDTPGHHDFSEDTYRTLMAADCAVMVIDLAKGVESQTEKLFRVCALRRIPVLTFVNKVDRPGRDPLDVLADIETKLGIEATPFNWPLGSGREFRGVVERGTRIAHLFDDKRGDHRIPFRSVPFDALDEEMAPDRVRRQTSDELELIEGAGAEFDRERFLTGKVSPVYWGSALTNYGIEHFLRGFLDLCPPPGDRPSDAGPVPAAQSAFSAFVFKIQANLDPRHRDRVAFVRVCSGRFVRDMEVVQSRTGRKLRLPRALRLFAQDRETMDEAYPGDILGLVNPGEFLLGDTICQGQALNFEPLPQFCPEHFATMRCTDTARRKQFNRGMEQLIEEGAIQSFQADGSGSAPILGAVGELQFDVVRFRLESEYNAPSVVDWLPYKAARWVHAEPAVLAAMRLTSDARRVIDSHGRTVVLFPSNWDAEYAARHNPNIVLSTTSQPG